MKLDPLHPIVICRSARPPEPLEPTYTLGYSCVLCAKPLQVSRTGVKQIRKQRGQPICNACGCVVVEGLNASQVPVELRLSPEATAQVEQVTGEPILDTFPTATTEILEEEN